MRPAIRTDRSVCQVLKFENGLLGWVSNLISVRIGHVAVDVRPIGKIGISNFEVNMNWIVSTETSLGRECRIEVSGNRRELSIVSNTLDVLITFEAGLILFELDAPRAEFPSLEGILWNRVSYVIAEYGISDNQSGHDNEGQFQLTVSPPASRPTIPTSQLVSLTLKYSETMILTTSGTVAIFRIFRSFSRASIISSVIATVIFEVVTFVANVAPALDGIRRFIMVLVVYAGIRWRKMATTQELESRRIRGQAIANVESNVRRLDATEYRVKSQSGNGKYQVVSTEAGWYCSCPDAITRVIKCKHIFAVELSLEIRRRIESAKRIVPLDYQACLSCGSKSIVKHGLLHNKSGDLQRYSCKECGKRFTLNLGFEGMRATPKAITGAMQLYFTGESLRNVQKFLRMQGVKVSHVTIYRWIGKYVGIMERYLKDFTPNVSDTWRTDEMFVKFSGNMKYLFAMMDDETRFRISQMVADHKGTDDVRPMFKAAIEATGKIPKTLISDGADNFHAAYYSEFKHPSNLYGEGESATHIREIRMAGVVHNNKMERQNGEVRDREKTMRGLKNADSPIIAGLQIFHNYIRTHEGLEGKTPAEAAGITVEGANKWLTIIQNASHVQTCNKENDVQ